MNNLSIFADILNDIMIEKNINANTLAKAIKVGDSTISRYLHEQRLPSIEILVKIADYFNCTTDYLLGLEDENFTQEFLPSPPFNERLTHLLDNYKYTSYHIYRNTGISQGRFYDWKNGVSKPTVDNIVKLAKFFNCSVDFVIGRSKV